MSEQQIQAAKAQLTRAALERAYDQGYEDAKIQAEDGESVSDWENHNPYREPEKPLEARIALAEYRMGQAARVHDRAYEEYRALVREQEAKG